MTSSRHKAICFYSKSNIHSPCSSALVPTNTSEKVLALKLLNIPICSPASLLFVAGTSLLSAEFLEKNKESILGFVSKRNPFHITAQYKKSRLVSHSQDV